MQCSDDPEQEFNFYLEFVKPLVLSLADTEVRTRAAAWLKYLREAKDDIQLRTNYLKLLVFALQRGRLVGPFANLPDGEKPLEPFPDQATLTEMMRTLSLLAGEERGAGDRPAVSVNLSHDMKQFLSLQTLPWQQGVHCYMAFSPHKYTSWPEQSERSKKSSSSRKRCACSHSSPPPARQECNCWFPAPPPGCHCTQHPAPRNACPCDVSCDQDQASLSSDQQGFGWMAPGGRKYQSIPPQSPDMQQYWQSPPEYGGEFGSISLDESAKLAAQSALEAAKAAKAAEPQEECSSQYNDVDWKAGHSSMFGDQPWESYECKTHDTPPQYDEVENEGEPRATTTHRVVITRSAEPMPDGVLLQEDTSVGAGAATTPGGGQAVVTAAAKGKTCRRVTWVPSKPAVSPRGDRTCLSPPLATSTPRRGRDFFSPQAASTPISNRRVRRRLDFSSPQQGPAALYPCTPSPIRQQRQTRTLPSMSPDSLQRRNISRPMSPDSLVCRQRQTTMSPDSLDRRQRQTTMSPDSLDRRQRQTTMSPDSLERAYTSGRREPCPGLSRSRDNLSDANSGSWRRYLAESPELEYDSPFYRTRQSPCPDEPADTPIRRLPRRHMRNYTDPGPAAAVRSPRPLHARSAVPADQYSGVYYSPERGNAALTNATVDLANRTFEAVNRTYDAPNRTYDAPNRTYDAPNRTFNRANTTYNAANATFDAAPKRSLRRPVIGSFEGRATSPGQFSPSCEEESSEEVDRYIPPYEFFTPEGDTSPDRRAFMNYPEDTSCWYTSFDPETDADFAFLDRNQRRRPLE